MRADIKWCLGVIWAAATALSQPLPAAIAEVREAHLAGGIRIEYVLATPADFCVDQSYPALLVFPGGKQTMDSVRANLARYWQDEALRRGYIVISPAAPAGRPFYEDGADLIPEFLQLQLVQFRIAGGKFHAAGLSNGGVSAFAVAVRNPQLFHSLTALAGFPVEQIDFDRLHRLRNIRVTMFVGNSDLYWKEGMERTRDRLASLGTQVYFEVIPRNGHFLPDLSFENSARIFERIGR